MRVLFQVVLALLVWSGGPVAAQEARGGAAPAVFAELRSLEATLAEVCRTGAQRLDDAAWAAWKRREELMAGLDGSLRGRLLRFSRLEPDCRTRLATLAQQRAAAAQGRHHYHYRQRPAPPSVTAQRPRPEPPRVDTEPRAAPPATGVNKPLFPWPPPTASTSRAFSPDVDAGRPRARRVGEVADRVRLITAAAGYDKINFYTAPGGFALVTRLEQLEADTGRPLPEPDRWQIPSRPIVASFGLELLLDAVRLVRNPGYFRVFVFVLTNKGVETAPADDDEAYRLAIDWAQRGADVLDPAIRALPVTPDHSLLVLVYEFERTGEKSEHLRPSRWTLDDHLDSIGASLKSLP